MEMARNAIISSDTYFHTWLIHLTPILYMKDLGHRSRTSSILSKTTLQGGLGPRNLAVKHFHLT